MKLKKKLGLLDIFCVSSGAMISSGLFVLPGLVFAEVGPSIILSYIIAWFLVIPSVLSKAELVTAMPKAGGIYFFIDRSFGPAVGTIGGFSAWLSLSLKSAFALAGMGIFVTLITPTITYTQIKYIAAGLCIIFTLLNIIGIKEAGKVQVILVLVLLGLLGLYILRSFPLIQPQRYIPFMKSGFRSVLATAGLVFVSYGGLTKIASVAEETKNPGRNIPLGMFLAFFIVGIIYVLVVFISTGILKPSKFANSYTPISIGAKLSMGNFGLIIMSIAALLAFVSTANAGIMTASRNPMAMSKDELLPDFLKKVRPKFGTPYYSILLTGGFMICVILFLDLKNLVKVASSLKLLLFMLANLSVIGMRESKVWNYQPKFRSPLYPWIQIIGVLGSGFLLIRMGNVAIITIFLLIVGGLGWYWIYARPKVKREYALVYIIQRITSRDLTRGLLSEELREVLKERDEIVEDRFDSLIQKCKIIDFKSKITLEDLLKKVSTALAPSLGMKEENLFSLLLAREKESPTIITPGLAIPHITIDGSNKFEILLARCKEGIIFSQEYSPVYAVFVLVGSKDERNFHLRALAAIAQIASQPDFDKKWLNVEKVEELRDLILLGRRKRYKLTS
jgi:amino acid transporter/mannitol/fructose-specific phosphotransferase system IIA component (Ntr-type)